jgi:protein-tyrosine phosphatase
MAEGILRDLSIGSNIIVDSAGTLGYHEGAAPDDRAQICMKRYGHDISSLRARPFKVFDFDLFDRIFVMDKANLKDVLSLARDEEDEQKVGLLLAETLSSDVIEVPDPYWDGDEGFTYVYHLLHDACSIIIEKYGR